MRERDELVRYLLNYRGSLSEVLEKAPNLADRMLSTKTGYTYDYLYISGIHFDHEDNKSSAYIYVPERRCEDSTGRDILSEAIEIIEETLALPAGYRFSDMRGANDELIVLHNRKATIQGYINCLKDIATAVRQEMRRLGFTRAKIYETDSNSPYGPVYEVECARTMPIDAAKIAAGVKVERRRSSLGQTSKEVRGLIKQGEPPPVKRKKKRRSN